MDVDTTNMYNYAVFVQILDENKESKKIFFGLSPLFDPTDDDRIKSLMDFIDRINSYGL
jgi:hypothetical protein